MIGIMIAAVPAIVGLVAWLAYLLVAVFIVAYTRDTKGLHDLASAAKAYRRRLHLRPKAADPGDDRTPTEDEPAA